MDRSAGPGPVWDEAVGEDDWRVDMERMKYTEEGGETGSPFLLPLQFNVPLCTSYSEDKILTLEEKNGGGVKEKKDTRKTG